MSDRGAPEAGAGPSRSVPRVLSAILARAWREIARDGRAWAALWGGVLVVSVALYPYDRALLDTVQALGAGQYRLAEVLSTIGRFENSSLLFAVILASVGLLGGGDRWKRAAVGCLLAGVVAGLAVTVLRPGLGRARPHAEAAPGFYFLEIDSDFHSMPSGHVGTNAASALAIARLVPPLAVPAVVYAGAMGWSRMQLNRHYPTDVLWGLTLGGTIGWAVAGGIVGRRRRDRSRSYEPS